MSCNISSTFKWTHYCICLGDYKVFTWWLGTPASALTPALEVRTASPLDLDSTLGDHAIFLLFRTQPLTGTISLLAFAECVGRNNTHLNVLCVIRAVGRRQPINIQLQRVRVGKMNFSGSSPSIHRNYYEPRSILSCAYGREWNCITRRVENDIEYWLVHMGRFGEHRECESIPWIPNA
jgi:hypothetical protein